MRLAQGTFSLLPDLTDGQIRVQIEYCLEQGWAVSIEYTDDPHPRNTPTSPWSNPDGLGSAAAPLRGRVDHGDVPGRALPIGLDAPGDDAARRDADDVRGEAFVDEIPSSREDPRLTTDLDPSWTPGRKDVVHQERHA